MTDETLVPSTVFVLCMLTSLACTFLLVRTYGRTRSRLLLWTALGFSLFTVNNLLLVLDMLVFRHLDLWPYRALSFLAGLLLLLFGFIWETD